MKNSPHQLQVETLEDRVTPSTLSFVPSVPVPPPWHVATVVAMPTAPTAGFVTYGIGTSPSGPGR